VTGVAGSAELIWLGLQECDVTDLSSEALAHPVAGRNLTGSTMKDQLYGNTLVVFIRHFG
jgi:hypothetical protein